LNRRRHEHGSRRGEEIRRNIEIAGVPEGAATQKINGIIHQIPSSAVRHRWIKVQGG